MIRFEGVEGKSKKRNPLDASALYPIIVGRLKMYGIRKYRSILVFLAVSWAAVPACGQVADEQASYRLAQVYEQAGRFEDALRYYESLSRTSPGNPTYFDGVRRCLVQLKRYADVIALITDRIARYPRETMLLVHRGTARHLNGDEGGAQEDWEEAIRREPHNAGIYAAVADEALRNRLYDLAVRVLLRGRDALKSPQMFVMEVARAYMLGMKYDDAMREYISFVVAVPSALWQVQQQIAQFSEIPQALESAVRVTTAEAKARRDNLTVRYLLAWLLMERKDYAAAKNVYAEIDRLHGANGFELMGFAQRAFNEGAYRVAAEAFRELLSQYPQGAFAAEAAFMHARCTEELAGAAPPAELDPLVWEKGSSPPASAYAEAVRLYEDVAAKYPHQQFGLESLYRIAWIRFHRFGDVDGALALLKDIAPQRRNVMGRVDGYILTGDIFLAKGDVRKAKETYAEILGMRQLSQAERQKVEYNTAEILYFEGDFDGALAALEPLTENSADDITNDALSLALFIRQFRVPSDEPLKLYARAAFLERCRKRSEAAELLRHLIQRHADSPLLDQAYVKRAEHLRSIGQADSALAALSVFLEKYPDAVIRDRALFLLGTIYEEDVHDMPKALETYERILTEHPLSSLVPTVRQRIIALRKSHS
ncbi:MAG: tetratricopeptide repeat protein [Bacteroidota bacterium]|nr:tetratricopeptide repeat protein [Bacteroidota bacterium]